MININKAEKRQKRAEFWASFATGVALAADVYAATNYEYYAPGVITMSTAILAYSIAASVNERMGLKYSREQEMEADKCAVELMKYIDVTPTALASALSKIKNYCIITGNYLSLSGEGTHPALDDRIRKIGKPSSFYDIEYDKTISFVNRSILKASWRLSRGVLVITPLSSSTIFRVFQRSSKVNSNRCITPSLFSSVLASLEPSANFA